MPEGGTPLTESDESRSAESARPGPAARAVRWLLDRADRPGGVLVLVVLALFEEVARPVLASRGLLGQLDALGALYRGNAFLALASSGYTPIPYMLYTMAAGAFDVPFPTFVAGSLVGRALKYAPLAGLAYFLGPAARRYVERYAGWTAAAMVAIAIVFFVLAR